jgi:hypothetical protein
MQLVFIAMRQFIVPDSGGGIEDVRRSRALMIPVDS